MSPQYVTRDDVPARCSLTSGTSPKAHREEDGKPAQIIPRIVEGRLGGFYKDVVLLERASVSDDEKTVGQLLKRTVSP